MDYSEDELDAMLDELDTPTEVETPTLQGASAMQTVMALQNEEENPNRVFNPKMLKVVKAVEAIAYADLGDYMTEIDICYVKHHDDEGEPVYGTFQKPVVRSLAMMTPEQRRCIKKYKVIPTPHGDRIEFELYPADAALEKLMRHTGAYAEDNRQQANAGSLMLQTVLDNAFGRDAMDEPIDSSGELSDVL